MGGHQGPLPVRADQLLWLVARPHHPTEKNLSHRIHTPQATDIALMPVALQFLVVVYTPGAG